MNPTITTASVKIMRSFDYCHFEVVLGVAPTLVDPNPNEVACLTATDIDNARKEAMRLVDKAVAQYKVAKAEAQRIENTPYELERLGYHVREIEEEVAETDRTPAQQAALKEFKDRIHALSVARRPRYDYEDDWQDEETED